MPTMETLAGRKPHLLLLLLVTMALVASPDSTSLPSQAPARPQPVRIGPGSPLARPSRVLAASQSYIQLGLTQKVGRSLAPALAICARAHWSERSCQHGEPGCTGNPRWSEEQSWAPQHPSLHLRQGDEPSPGSSDQGARRQLPRGQDLV
ncbi:Hypothetical predicted protein [Marmota monax]|uniref:Uncharacterized protein n=1 Tax=Marmota monax TaxID=9995 RepID=A0A5E4AF75_MARMO|nr:hypothetical protein GHT09_000792 [Marmota monax]VTJ56033.1 Hypothetical predicted protein [Marmota monax]